MALGGCEFWKIAFVWVVLRNICRVYPTERAEWGRTLLLTAHPDDESMFFGPLLYRTRPRILCLSDGGFDGLGKTRRGEMLRLCKSLDISCSILGYMDNNRWEIPRIIKDLAEHVLAHGVRTVMTFDEHGVSGHHNHTSCFYAARTLEKLLGNDVLKFRYLRTTNFFQKYIFDFGRKTHSIPFFSVFSIRNMLFHRSQMVWFRYLYCLLSNYMYFNEYTSC